MRPPTNQTIDDAIVGQCLRTACQLTETYRSENPPFSLRPLLDRFQIAEVRTRLLDRDARLIVEAGRLVIEVNSIFSRVRRRLSIAHEIGHLIVSECMGVNRLATHCSDYVAESLCDRLAAELLVPGWAVHSHFEKLRSLAQWQDSIRCSTILEAAKWFGVSVDAMAARVFRDLALAPTTVAIIWRQSRNTKNPRSKMALRISSVWHSMADIGFVPLNKTAPKSSIILKAFHEDGVFRREEQLSLGGAKGTFIVEASGFTWFPLPAVSSRERGVISLLSQ